MHAIHGAPRTVETVELRRGENEQPQIVFATLDNEGMLGVTILDLESSALLAIGLLRSMVAAEEFAEQFRVSHDPGMETVIVSLEDRLSGALMRLRHKDAMNEYSPRKEDAT